MNNLFFIQDKNTKQFLEGWDFNSILLTKNYMDARSYFSIEDAREILKEILDSNPKYLDHNEIELIKVELEVVQINFIPVE